MLQQMGPPPVVAKPQLAAAAAGPSPAAAALLVAKGKLPPKANTSKATPENPASWQQRAQKAHRLAAESSSPP